MQRIIKNKTVKKHTSRASFGFTLIEVIIYCSIFITFAVVAIESMIWMNSQLLMQGKMSEIINMEVYKMNFSNIYKRYRLNNRRIENEFGDLIASSTKTGPSIIEDVNMNIILDKHDVIRFNNNKKDGQEILFFDSIDNGV